MESQYNVHYCKRPEQVVIQEYGRTRFFFLLYIGSSNGVIGKDLGEDGETITMHISASIQNR
jgi:hypothetical protein